MFVFRFYASVNSLIDGKCLCSTGFCLFSVLNQEYCSHVLYKKNPEVSSYDDLSYYTYIDNICFYMELTKKLKNFMDAIFLLIRCPQMNWKKWSNFSIQKT